VKFFSIIGIAGIVRIKDYTDDADFADYWVGVFLGSQLIVWTRIFRISSFTEQDLRTQQ